jgi:Holliday junction DNA helicase RuvA
MYAHIEGVLAEKGQEGLVIDCGGVGYAIIVSASTLAAAPNAGERMKCYTILNVREDAMEPIGFTTSEEKRMYEKLRGVSGIGPRTALQILSSLSVSALSLALVTGDVAALSRAQGVGKKTAQRLILELREKVDNEELFGTGAVNYPAMSAGGAASDAIEALMALGYQSSEAAKAVAALSPMPEKVDEIVFLALKGMSK